MLIVSRQNMTGTRTRPTRSRITSRVVWGMDSVWQLPERQKCNYLASVYALAV